MQAVNCGQCKACRIRRVYEWTGRLLAEGTSHSDAAFLTLTYADDPGELDYVDFQKFLKRFRQTLPMPVRFFGVGEYGESNGRGHWHSIIFGFSPGETQFRRRMELPSWGQGSVWWDAFNSKTAAYVSQYSVKSIGKGAPITSSSRRPGLGHDFYNSYGAALALKGKQLPVKMGLKANGTFYPFDYYARQITTKAFVKHGGILIPFVNDGDSSNSQILRSHCDYLSNLKEFEYARKDELQRSRRFLNVKPQIAALDGASRSKRSKKFAEVEEALRFKNRNENDEAGSG